MRPQKLIWLRLDIHSLQHGRDVGGVMGHFRVASNGALVSGHTDMHIFLFENGASLFDNSITCRAMWAFPEPHQLTQVT